jgi:cytoskeletal protein RodZ
MSDELSPPPLRLKPRLKPEGETISPAPFENALSAAPAAAESATIQVEPPRLKLRPKMSAPPTAQNIEPSPEGPGAPSALKPRLSLAEPPASMSTPEASALPVSADSDLHLPAAQSSSLDTPAIGELAVPEAPKFKLKDPSALSQPAALAPLSPPSGNILASPLSKSLVGSVTPPIFPVVANEASNAAEALPPPIPKRGKPPVRRAPARSSPSRTRLIFLLAAVVLLAGTYLGYTRFMSDSPAPGMAEAPSRPATPSPALNAIAAAPAQAIEKAEAAVAAANAAAESAPIEAARFEERNASPSAKATRPVVKPAAAPVTSTTQLAPGLTVTTAAKVVGDASPAFRSWVADARVSGVFQGTPARILINGRTVTAGELVDASLGVTFEGIDASTKSLLFRDQTGAGVARKF